jgi:hypothetical protein
MLRHESEGGFVASGLALLRVRPDRAFHHPTRVAVEVAKQLITLGYS